MCPLHLVPLQLFWRKHVTSCSGLFPYCALTLLLYVDCAGWIKICQHYDVQGTRCLSPSPSFKIGSKFCTLYSQKHICYPRFVNFIFCFDCSCLSGFSLSFDISPVVTCVHLASHYQFFPWFLSISVSPPDRLTRD